LLIDLVGDKVLALIGKKGKVYKKAKIIGKVGDGQYYSIEFEDQPHVYYVYDPDRLTPEELLDN
jgi:hypothetical protein